MKILVKKKYKIRHEILKTLVQKTKLAGEHRKNEDDCLTIKQLSEKLNYTIEEIDNQIAILCAKEQVVMVDSLNGKVFIANEDGGLAYRDEFHLNEGKIKYYESYIRKFNYRGHHLYT